MLCHGSCGIRPRHSKPRPTIELMPSINVHSLRHAIPRYRGQINQPDVSLKHPDLADLRTCPGNGHSADRDCCWQEQVFDFG